MPESQTFPPLTASKPQGRSPISPQVFALLAGTLFVISVCAVPIWDAVRLLDDEAIIYFLGQDLPLCTIVACWLATMGYVIMVTLVFRFARPEHRTEQTVLMMGTIISTALGLSFLCISQQMMFKMQPVYMNLFSNCPTGEKTHELYEYSLALHQLRTKPTCVNLVSVEQCKGFREVQPYTDVLRAMEQNYECSGFCVPTLNELDLQPSKGNVINTPNVNKSQPSNASVPHKGNVVNPLKVTRPPNMNNSQPVSASVPHKGAGAASIPKNASLLSVIGQIKPRPFIGALRHLASERQWQWRRGRGGGANGASLLQVEVAEVTQHRQPPLLHGPPLQPGKIGTYPPTLFSRANYEASCEGMTARTVKHLALDVATVLYKSGLSLLAGSVAVTLLTIGGGLLNTGVK